MPDLKLSSLMISRGVAAVTTRQGAIVSSGGLADLTSEQLAQIVEGSVVAVSDGRRFVYKGTGSKTDEANYVVLSDTTPDWSSVVNKPASFPPSTHASSHSASGSDPVNITAAQISNATPAGRELLTAADASAQRAALGLGSAALKSEGDFVPTTGPATIDISEEKHLSLEMGAEGSGLTHLRFTRDGAPWAVVGEGGGQDFVVGTVGTSPAWLLWNDKTVVGHNSFWSFINNGRDSYESNSAEFRLLRSSGQAELKAANLIVLSPVAINSNLSVAGNTTLGDASGDALTVNAATLTAPNATDTSANRIANVGALDKRYKNYSYINNFISFPATSTDLQDTPLQLQLDSNTWYDVEVRMSYGASGGASNNMGHKLRLNYSGTVAVDSIPTRYYNGNVAWVHGPTQENSPWTVNTTHTCAPSGQDAHGALYIRGAFKTNTAGTLTVQVAPHTAAAAGFYEVRGGSFLKCIRMD